MPTGRSEIKVLAPSIFHAKADLVKRCLSGQELMDVYDVDVCVQTNYLSLAKSHNQEPLTTFVRQVPGKFHIAWH